MTFSLRAGTKSGIHRAVERAQVAEAAGFDQIWCGNDIFARSGPVTLSAIAAHTDRIRIGVSVLEPVSMHPAQIAQIAASLQELSRGRFLLGIGAGSQVFFDFAGLEQGPPVRRTREAIVAVRHLLAGESPADDPQAGDGWTERALLHAPPDSPPPIYVGAIGPQMLTMAGRVADGALPLCLPPRRFLRARDLIATGAADAGRDLAGFDLVACLWCSIDEDGDQARLAMADFIARYSGSLAPEALVEEGLDPDEFAYVQRLVLDEGIETAVAAVTPAMLRLGIVGGPGDVIEQCEELIDAGAHHLSFGPPVGPDVDGAIDVIGRKVLPTLRSRLAA